MTDVFATVAFGFIIFVPMAVFMRQLRRVRDGTQGRAKAVASFVGLSLLPVLAYVLVFLALLAIEEVGKYAVVGEGFARSLLPIVGIGVSEVILLAIAFALTVAIQSSRKDAI